jgi:putative oxidoreductase
MTTLSMHQHDSLTTGAFRRTVNAILATDASWTNVILRLTLGLVMFPHGAQKVFGWFGGYGLSGTLSGFQSMGIPTVFGLLAVIAESLGAIALIAGFATRIAAFGIGTTLVVAALMAHRAHFFMNWSGQQGGEGFEYHILAVSIAVVLVLRGAGRASIDRFLTR